MQFVFGPGQLIVTPLTDAFGNAIANPSPRRLGAFQEGTFDSSAPNKKLYGSSGYPLAVGRGKSELSIKVKAAQFSIDQYNAIFIGQPANQVNSLVSAFIDTQGSVIPSTGPYTITPAIPGTGGAWARDLGVLDSAGNALTNEGSSGAVTATGEYSVSAGTYTFDAADAGKTVFISFGYTNSTAPGKSLTVKNVQMGQAPFVQVDFLNNYGGNTLLITLYQAVCSKTSFGTKLDDFTEMDLEFDGFVDGLGRAYTISANQ